MQHRFKLPIVLLLISRTYLESYWTAIGCIQQFVFLLLIKINLPSQIVSAWQDLRGSYNAIELIPNIVKMFAPVHSEDNKQLMRAGLYHYTMGYLINYVYIMLLLGLVIAVVRCINKKKEYIND
jgi:hypothetical protein